MSQFSNYLSHLRIFAKFFLSIFCSQMHICIHYYSNGRMSKNTKVFYGLSRYYCNKYATNMWCGFSNYSFKIPLCLALVRSKYFSQCKATSGIFFLSKYQNPLYPSIAGPFFSFSVFYNMTLKIFCFPKLSDKCVSTIYSLAFSIS